MATRVCVLDGGGPTDSENTLNSFLTKCGENVFWQIGTDMSIFWDGRFWSLVFITVWIVKWQEVGDQNWLYWTLTQLFFFCLSGLFYKVVSLGGWMLKNSGFAWSLGLPCILYGESSVLGLPKIFGVSCFKLQTGNWPKTWRYAKFQVNPRLFCHVRSAPKTSGLPIKMASGGCFRGSTDVVKRPRMDLKLGIPSQFGPISSLEFKDKKFG